MDTFVSGLSEQHPVLTPVVGIANQLERLAGQWVERVGDNEPSHTVCTICS